MGIKRCPSFSKRPGFPCGLRVLLVDGDTIARDAAEVLLKDCHYTVTCCSTTAEALVRLTSGSNCYDVLLADKSLVSGKTSDKQQLLDSCNGLPCILMAQDPSPEDIMAGIKLGAVDFLAKPLSPLKLQNIWQHTVRKMMGNMNINCSADASQASAPVAPTATAAAKKELAEMEVILEEPEQEQQAMAAEAAAGSTPAATATTSAFAAASKSVVNTAANVALATASSLYEPTRCLSRSGSCVTTETSFALAGPGSPTKGAAGGASKLHKSRHAPVHSCPSTRSLNSASSCYSTLQLAVPPTPNSPGSSDTGDATEVDNATAAAAQQNPTTGQQQQQQQRCIKKAVRHVTPVTPASKPPLASKPQAAQTNASSSMQKPPAAASMGPGCNATAAGPLPLSGVGHTAVPLPTGLGPLPQGMVWGMPMCPLARAPGIVPPTNTASSSASQAAVSAAAGSAMLMPSMTSWAMCGMPMGMPGTYMPGMMMPGMPLAMSFGYGAGMMGGYNAAYDAAQQQQQVTAQDPAAAAAAPVATLPVAPQMQQQSGAAVPASTGAAMAAALNASLDGLSAAAPAEAAPATEALDVGDAFDFMLGDITAEDDLDMDMSGLLDGELAALEKDGLKLPSDLQELEQVQQEQQQQQQYHQQRASFECSNRLSFDCHGRQRVSFDCSTASTTTNTRVSFECSAASRASLCSQRVSFEVNCNSAARAAQQHGNMAAATVPPTNCGNSNGSALLGSMSDLFASGCGDSCSEGSNGMTHVDSCGMLADLQSLFAGDGGCAGIRDDGCSGNAAASAGLFDDVMDDLPLELALKKSSSLAELLNAGLTPMHA